MNPDFSLYQLFSYSIGFFERESATQWEAAVEQIHGYACGEKVRHLCRGTQLHCIVMQFCGWELARMEEV